MIKTSQDQGDVKLAVVVGTQSKLLAAIAKQTASLSSATADQLNSVNAALQGALEEIYHQVTLSANRRAFIDKYQIEVISDHEIRVNLGDTSRIDFMREAQELAPGLHGQNAVWPDRLERWAATESFQTAPEQEIAVDGNVANSTERTREQQEAKGWCNVSLEDLAVAHIANFIATGNDLFGGNVVRARGGALYFGVNGLNFPPYIVFDDSGYNDMAASAALPSRN